MEVHFRLAPPSAHPKQKKKKKTFRLNTQSIVRNCVFKDHDVYDYE